MPQRNSTPEQCPSVLPLNAPLKLLPPEMRAVVINNISKARERLMFARLPQSRQMLKIVAETQYVLRWGLPNRFTTQIPAYRLFLPLCVLHHTRLCRRGGKLRRCRCRIRLLLLGFLNFAITSHLTFGHRARLSILITTKTRRRMKCHSFRAMAPAPCRFGYNAFAKRRFILQEQQPLEETYEI